MRAELLQWPPHSIPEVFILPAVWVRDDVVNRALDSQGGAEKLQFNISPLRPLLLSKTEYKPKKD